MTLLAVLQQMRCTTPAHIRRHPLRYALSILSIAVAVALFVSMRITQSSIIHAFRDNLDALAGSADHRVTSAAPIRSDVLSAVERVDGVLAAPVVQDAIVLAHQRQTVMLLGIDAVRESRLRRHRLTDQIEVDLPTLLLRPNAAVVPERLARRHGWHIGERIPVTGPSGRAELTLAGLLKTEGAAAALDGNIVFMEVGAAARLLARDGAFDRIEMALGTPERIDAVQKALSDLDASLQLEPIRTGDATFEYIYIQFQTILVCVNLMACVIALFIVYNTMSLSVVQRSREIGTLRALGARRGEILLVYLFEAALLGLFASILGAIIGFAVSDKALDAAASTMTIMIELGSTEPVIPFDVWLLAPFVGMVAAVLGAIVPARAAANMPPIDAMKPGKLEQQMAIHAGLWMSCGIVLMCLCAALVWHPRTEWTWTAVGILFGMFGIALVGPQILVWLTPTARRLADRISSIPAQLAVDSIVKFPSRSSLTIFALGGSLSLVVAVTSMVGGLQHETEYWIDDVFAFDLVAQTNDMTTSAYPTGVMPAHLLDEVRRDPECSDAYGVRILRLLLGGDEVMITAYEVDIMQKGRFERGRSRDLKEDLRRIEALQSGKVDISHNLAHLQGLSVGDRITLQTPTGPHDFEIDTIQRDYSWFRGCIFMDLDVYRKYWEDDSLSFLDIRAHAGTDLETYRTKLTSRWAERYGLFVYRIDQMKDHASRYLSEWFALANLQLVLAVFIGGVGVANTLLVSVLTQTRQIGLLRAIGATTRQIQGMLAGEALLLGLLGGLAGCAIGLSTVKLLVSPMAMKATGYDLVLALPYGPMAASILAAVVIALGAALLPMRAMKRIDLIQAIGYE